MINPLSMRNICHKFFTVKWRNVIYILLFFSTAASGQEVIDEDFIDILTKNAQELFSEQDADFAVKTIPEKWINESAVTIGYKKHILFDKKRSGLLGGKENLVLLEKKRMKVKLADN